jgi:hypothetical protein
VAESTEAFVKALGGAADKPRDVVGMAFAVNGKVQEVNIFPGRPLAQRVYPRLLETYALDAVMQASDKTAAKAKAPASDQVLALMKTRVRDEAQREERINDDNGLSIHAAEKADARGELRFYRCATNYKGKTVHLLWIQGPQSLEAAAQDGDQRQQSGGNRNRDDAQQQERP